MTYKGFTLGKTYHTTVDLLDERNATVSAGTSVRLVAIAPKVCMTKVSAIFHTDGLPYFYNAVRADQESDSGNRIRANFCTLQKP